MVYFLKPIYIDKNEGIGSVISRLENTAEQQIALIFPPDSFVFKNVLEIQYLKREATRLGKDIVIITPDKGQEELAKSFGLKVKSDLFEKPEESEFLKGFYKKPEETQRIEVNTGQPVGEVHKTLSSEETKKFSRFQDQSTSKSVSSISLSWLEKISKLSFKGYGVYLYGALFISFIVLVYVVSSVILNAEVVVKPAKVKINYQETVKFVTSADEVDLAKNTLPLEIFTVTKEKSNTFPASGEKEVSLKAKGTITVFNNYSSEPQTMVQRTRFLSKDNKLFRAVKKVVVPGYKIENGKIVAGRIDIEVEADEPGESFNIGPTTFTIPGFKGQPQYEKISGESFSAMKGGKSGKTKFVTKADLEKAKNTLLTLVKSELTEDLKTNFPKDYNFFEEIRFKDVEEQSDFKENEPAEVFTYKIKATGEILGYKKSKLYDFIKLKLKDDLEGSKVILEEKTAIRFSNINASDDSSRLSAVLNADVFISYVFDEKWLKEILAGKGEKEIESFRAGYPEIERLEVSIRPGIPLIGSKLPKDPSKIKIIIDYGT